MNNPDRDPALGIELITDYGAGMGVVGPDDGMYVRRTVDEKAIALLEVEREHHLDIVQELTDAIRRIKEGLR